MGLHLSCAEQCSKLRQCRPKSCLLKFSSFRKSKPAFVGNDIAVAAWTLLSAELGRLGGLVSFPTGCKGERTCSPSHHNSCGTCTSRWAGSENFGNSSGWRCDFWSACPFCRCADPAKKWGSYCGVPRRRRPLGLGRRGTTTRGRHD